MQDAVPYADIVILALVAGFILLRLRGILGRTMDDDAKDFMARREQPKPADEPAVVKLADRPAKPKAEPEAAPDACFAALPPGALRDGIERIRGKDAAFSATEFLEGAKRAFDMVFVAFTKADKSTLKMLLSDALYAQFAGEIDAQESAETRRETTLVSILAAEITQADMSGNAARIGVKFTSEQVSIVRGRDKAIVEGDPSQLQHVEDEWTFERDVTSKSPNWKIIET